MRALWLAACALIFGELIALSAGGGSREDRASAHATFGYAPPRLVVFAPILFFLRVPVAY